MNKKYFLIILICFLFCGCVTKGKFVIIEEKDVCIEPEVKEMIKIEETTKEQTLKSPDIIVTKEAEIKKEEIVKVKEEEKVLIKKEEVTKEKEIIVKKEEIKPKTKKKRAVENKAFGVGEKFTFAIQYLGVTAATASFEVKEKMMLDGNMVYHIVTKTQTTSVFSAIHKVDDNVETFIDYAGIFSRKLGKSLKEGNYTRDVILYFDSDKNTVKEVEKGAEKMYNIPDYCQDILSAFYYFRTQKIEIGETPTVDVHADGKNHKLQVRVLKKEKIKTPLGKYEAFVIKPFMQFESVFKQEGDVTIWCSTDERHMPLLMKSKVAVGSINAVLIDAAVTK